MRKRENGFYWVLVNGHWTIAEYWYDEHYQPCWEMTGTGVPFDDQDFTKINEERIKEPDE